jgi:elongation factor P
MLDYSELKKGTRIIFKNQPHEIIEAFSVFKGRGHSTLQVKLKNLITGNALSETFHPSDTFEEAELEKIKAKYIYTHRNEYFFSEEDNPSKRFSLTEEQIGNNSHFLKPNQVLEGIVFQDKIISISLPIKIEFKVDQAPPGLKGERAQAGTKTVTLETGAKINTPLFVKEGDIIEVNTETGEYVRRLEN